MAVADVVVVEVTSFVVRDLFAGWQVAGGAVAVESSTVPVPVRLGSKLPLVAQVAEGGASDKDSLHRWKLADYPLDHLTAAPD